jgi:serine/threonine protein kinase
VGAARLCPQTGPAAPRSKADQHYAHDVDHDDDEPRILLADFGIAHNVDDISGLTATNMTVGTVAYCAPEQLMGQELDGHADESPGKLFAEPAVRPAVLNGPTSRFNPDRGPQQKRQFPQ